jgi:hypothetical protein
LKRSLTPITKVCTPILPLLKEQTTGEEMVQVVNASVSGSENIRLHATHKLDETISVSGNVYYKGQSYH